VKSLESLLMEKGLLDPGALDALVDAFRASSMRGTLPRSMTAPRSCAIGCFLNVRLTARN
jgi:hypothetical protein